MLSEEEILVLANNSYKELPIDNPNFPPSPYYRFLKHLARKIQPNLSVELGVCGGGGSLHLCMGYSEGIVVGIDYRIEYQKNLAYIKKTQKNFRFLEDDSVIAAPKVFEQYGLIDILFIDTIHTYERTMVEYNSWWPYLSSKAVVCFDDLNRKQMHLNGQNIWKYIEKQGQILRLDFLHHSQEGDGGFGVLWGIQR